MNVKLNFSSMLTAAIFILTVGFCSTGVNAQTLQSTTPGTADNGHMHINGIGLFDTGVGAGVEQPQGVLDVGERINPDDTSGECPVGYIHVDYDGDLLIGSGECWKGTVVNDGKVGIMTTTPDESLHVEGSIKMVDGNEESGLVMTSDENGVGSWQSLPILNIWGSSVDASGNTDYYITGSNVGIGTDSPDYTLTVDGMMGIYGGTDGADTLYHTTFEGSGSQTSNIDYTLPSTLGGAGTVLTNDGSGILSWESVVSGLSATYEGFEVTNSLTIPGHNVTTAADSSNTLLGVNAGNTTMTGSYNSAFGYSSLKSNTTGGYNTASGWGSLYFNTTGYQNTASGRGSLQSNTTGSNNIALGKSAGFSNQTGSNNLFLGYKAGTNAETGSNNIIIGSEVGVPTTSTSNHLNIGNTIFGNIATGNVGIRTVSPDYTLTVDGMMGILEGGTNGEYHTVFQGGDQESDITYTLPSTQGVAGTVLTIDANGILSWEDVANVNQTTVTEITGDFEDLTVSNSLTIPGHNVQTATRIKNMEHLSWFKCRQCNDARHS